MYDIDFIRERRGDIKLHVREFLLYPEFWNKDENKIIIFVIVPIFFSGSPL